jgi:hypothetical protein
MDAGDMELRQRILMALTALTSPVKGEGESFPDAAITGWHAD